MSYSVISEWKKSEDRKSVYEAKAAVAINGRLEIVEVEIQKNKRGHTGLPEFRDVSNWDFYIYYNGKFQLINCAKTLKACKHEANRQLEWGFVVDGGYLYTNRKFFANGKWNSFKRRS
tara:strand:+ start:1401 stop:1754 length:354 start_codon:yes stop_codon:yes gene_type:complete